MLWKTNHWVVAVATTKSIDLKNTENIPNCAINLQVLSDSDLELNYEIFYKLGGIEKT